MKGFCFALLASLTLLVCAPGLCPAQTYDFWKPVNIFSTANVTGASVFKKVTCDSVITAKLRSTGRITGTDLAVTDSVISVTGDFSGALKGATTLGITGASTLTGGATVGASGTAVIKVVVVGDSLAFITASDTMWAWQPGTK